jgi:phage gp36-like protein
MTSYASTTEIQTAAGGAARYVELFDWDGDRAADADVVTQLQLEVDSWIDSFAGRRYKVPLESPSAVLRQHAAEEAVFRARAKRNLAADDDRTAHEERLRWLEHVAAGRVVPCDPLPAKASTNRSAWVSRDGDDVSRDKLKGAW